MLFRSRLKVADTPDPQRPAERAPKAADGKAAAPETPSKDPAENTRSKRGETPVADPAAAPWLAASQHALPVAAAATRRQADSDAAPTPAGGPVAGANADATAALQVHAATDTKARPESGAASQEALAQWASATRVNDAATQCVGQALVEDKHSLKPGPTETAPTAAALGVAAFNQIGRAHV